MMQIALSRARKKRYILYYTLGGRGKNGASIINQGLLFPSVFLLVVVVVVVVLLLVVVVVVSRRGRFFISFQRLPREEFSAQPGCDERETSYHITTVEM